MDFLAHLLTDNNYSKVVFNLTKTNHLVVNARINGIKGRFILDTGASNTCVGFDRATQFNLMSTESKTLAAGAGATNMETRLSLKNTLRLGRWTTKEIAVVIFNLTHVNQALTAHKVRSVDGIIGSDILLSGHAIIDYYNRLLFLKRF
jgi:predicted aspartyl protease